MGCYRSTSWCSATYPYLRRFWLSAPRWRVSYGAAALLSYTKKEMQTSNTPATPSPCVWEKGIARAWGARGRLCVLSPRCRFDPPPEQRTGGCSGGGVFGKRPEEHQQICGITHTISGHTFCPGWENISILPPFPHHFTVCILHLLSQHSSASLWLNVLW